jgi:hypothetical protein
MSSKPPIWATELKQAGNAPHIFYSADQGAQPEEIIAGMKNSEFVKLPAEKHQYIIDWGLSVQRRSTKPSLTLGRGSARD